MHCFTPFGRRGGLGGAPARQTKETAVKLTVSGGVPEPQKGGNPTEIAFCGNLGFRENPRISCKTQFLRVLVGIQRSSENPPDFHYSRQPLVNLEEFNRFWRCFRGQNPQKPQF